VPDRDPLVLAADQHLAHDQAKDALALADVEGRGRLTEPREEALEGLGELQVGLGVVKLGIERAKL
jgi:hypothetical protein